MKNEQIYNLDTIDKEIIYMLMSNSKTSLSQISEKIGISTTAVHQRIKKLEKTEIIENSVSQLNYKKIGFKVISFIGVYLDKPSIYKRIISELHNINEIVEAHCTTGNYTIFLKIICRDNNHLMSVINDILHFEGVLRTETFISLDQNINRQLKLD